MNDSELSAFIAAVREQDAEVFADVDDLAALAPASRAQTRRFVAWSRAATELRAKTGVFAAHWGGFDPSSLATLLVQLGHTARVDVEARSWDEQPAKHVASRLLSAFEQLGTLVVSAEKRDSDLGRLVRAFERLERERGFIAIPSVVFTQSDGWDDVASRQRSQRQTAVFWTVQGQQAFDACGNLPNRMYLYWRGRADSIAAVVREEGLAVEEPERENVGIAVSSTQPKLELPRFSELLDEPRPATRLKRDDAPVAVGAWRSVARLECPLTFPVGRMLLTGDTLYAGYKSTTRGPVRVAAHVLAVPSGEVRAVVAGTSMVAQLETIALLADGRVLVGLTDSVPTSEESPTELVASAGAPGRRRIKVTPSKVSSSQKHSAAVVLRVLEAGAERTVRVHCFTHGPRVRIFDVAADGRTVVMPSRDGAFVFELDGKPLARVGPPAEAYSRVALSPDGGRIVLGPLDYLDQLGIFGRDGARVCTLRPYEELDLSRSGRGFQDLFFEPLGRVLVVGTHVAEDLRFRFFLPDTGQRTWFELEAASAGARCCAVSPDGALIAFGRADGTLALNEVPAGKAVASGSVSSQPLTSVAFSRDGRLAVGDEGGAVVVLALA